LKGLIARERIAALRRLLARGETLRQAEKKLRVPRSTLGRWAKSKNLPRRGRGLSPEKQREVKRRLARGQSLYQIAREVPVSTQTAWHHRQVQLFRELIRRSNTPLPCRPWRCPGGGELLNVSYCILHGRHRPPGTAKRPRS
jgi:DNA-binding NarL/FixJ family response regulator